MAALSMSGIVISSAGSPPSEMGMNTRNTMSSGYPNEVNIPLRIGRRPVRNSGREMGVGEGGGEGRRTGKYASYNTPKSCKMFVLVIS